MPAHRFCGASMGKCKDDDPHAEPQLSGKRPRNQLAALCPARAPSRPSSNTNRLGFRAARPRELRDTTPTASSSAATGDENDAHPDPQPAVKHGRNCPGFRATWHSPEPQSVTASDPSSISTSSWITTLALDPNGRLRGRHKDRSHTPAVASLSSTPTPSISDITPVEDVTPAAADFLSTDYHPQEESTMASTNTVKPK